MKYKLIQNGLPDECENWFGSEEAVAFEEKEFDNSESANAWVNRMCVNAGSVTDPLFEKNKPTIMTVAEFNAEYAAEAENVYFW